MKVYSKLWVAIVFMALIVITLASQPARAAGPWYVAPGGDDSNDCLSAVSPCATINGTRVKASAGDTIFVAIGTYTGTGLEVVLLDKDATLSGGWESTFTMQSGISTIDGQGTRRGIFVNSGVTASIKRFIVENGAGPTAQGGGGIFNDGGTLTLVDSTVRGSSSHGGTQGGGILNRSGTLTLNNSTVTGNIANIGAGIYSDGIGTVILNNSTVVSNSSSGQGGGIYNLASVLSLTNSTVSDNSASIRGGGIYSDPPATVTLTNTTVSGNTAGWDGGGIYHTGNNSIVILNNSTVSNNKANDGGGMYTGGGVDSLVTLRNTILAGNVASINADCRAPSVTPTGSEGYNLIGDTSGCAFTPVLGDLTGIDPLLGPLQNNGGPTDTHALLPGSPAIDGGNPAGCTDHDGNPLTSDQRGVTRPQGAACDIGAYEFEPEGRRFKARLSGAKEVPPVQTNAKGWARFEVNEDETALKFGLAVHNIKEATATHIHCAPAGMNGPIGVTLFEGGPVTIRRIRILKGVITAPDDGNACGWEDLAAVVASMRSGSTYINIHTLANPGGEIRGQIEPIVP